MKEGKRENTESLRYLGGRELSFRGRVSDLHMGLCACGKCRSEKEVKFSYPTGGNGNRLRKILRQESSQTGVFLLDEMCKHTFIAFWVSTNTSNCFII